jgi:hypothetical protein
LLIWIMYLFFHVDSDPYHSSNITTMMADGVVKGEQIASLVKTIAFFIGLWVVMLILRVLNRE